MKKTIVLAIAIVMIVALLACPGWCRTHKAKQQPIKVLFEVNGCCHDFKNLPAMLADKLKATGDFEFTITEDRDELTPSRIGKYDIALFYTQGSEMTPDQEKGLTEFVKSGKGYAGIHCASDTFKNSDAYWQMVGGRFKGHNSGTFPVHFTVRNHEITQGLEDFSITDETYVHDYNPNSKLVVLARRATDDEPSVWVQNYGDGRVFFTALGHGKEAWENPTFETLVTRGLYWVAKRQPSNSNTCSNK